MSKYTFPLSNTLLSNSPLPTRGSSVPLSPKELSRSSGSDVTLLKIIQGLTCQLRPAQSDLYILRQAFNSHDPLWEAKELDANHGEHE